MRNLSPSFRRKPALVVHLETACARLLSAAIILSSTRWYLRLYGTPLVIRGKPRWTCLKASCLGAARF
jgi:hypothetical protein